MIICVMGMPGAGKTTLASGLARKYGFEHISAGDVARRLAETDPEVEAALATGNLAPREKMNAEMARVIDEAVDKVIILDGFPRYEQQLFMLSGNDVLYLILGCDEPTAIDRLLGRGRGDDKTTQIAQRIETFRTETRAMFSELLDSDRTRYIVTGTQIDTLNDAVAFLNYHEVHNAA